MIMKNIRFGATKPLDPKKYPNKPDRREAHADPSPEDLHPWLMPEEQFIEWLRIRCWVAMQDEDTFN
jgi:hypothetical protein